MAVLKRSKSTVLGLVTDLASLRSTDANLTSRLDVVQGDNQTDGSFLKADEDVKTWAQGKLDDFKNGEFKDLSDLVDVINGDSETDGSFRKAIADVIGSAPEALDTLKELADAINDDEEFASTITQLISDKYTELKNYVDDNKLDKAQNLADVADIEAARTNIDVYSKAEVDNAVINGGANPFTDVITVDGDSITLAHAPKGGVILNFSYGRVAEEDGTVIDVQVSKDTSDENKDDPKKYIVNGDESGQFDGKDIMIQYLYITGN